MCYTNSLGQWLDSSDEIKVLPNGTAAAIRGTHQIYFPSDIAQAPIEIVTGDGQHLKSRPTLISLDDGVNTVVVGTITNSIGQLIGSNQVMYPHAFSGCDADVLVTYRRSGLECDLVLRSDPGDPESFNLNPARTRIQLLTEYFNVQDPTAGAPITNSRDGLTDPVLWFGSMKMVHGKAFVIGGGSGTNHRPLALRRTPVYKSWLGNLQGRKFLVEEVPYRGIQKQLARLPATVRAGTPSGSGEAILYQVSATRLLPVARVTRTETNQIELAGANPASQPGVVLDYVMLDDYWTAGDLTLQSNETYFVSGYCEVDNLLTIQGGTVVKYAPNAELYVGGVVCQTGPYNMATFTAMDDNSVGAPIDGSTGNPQGLYASPALDLADGETCYNGEWNGGKMPSLSYLRFCYAATAINLPESDIGLDLRDSQLIQCDSAIYAYQTSGNFKPNFSVRNVLIDQIGTVAFYGDPYSGLVENVTLSGLDSSLSSLAYWHDDQVADYNLNLINCLARDNVFWGYTLDLGDAMALGGTCCFSNLDASAFQSAYAGRYYLAANSPYRNAGTSSIDNGYVNGPPLGPDLQQKTTYPPAGMINDVRDTVTLFPRVQRDTDAYDLGYHYDSLDYMTLGLAVESGATLNLTNGAVVGVYGDFNIYGDVFAPQQLLNTCVQEQPWLPLNVLIGCPAGVPITWDYDHDGLPDWWEFMYFGGRSQTATNLDGQGNTLLYDYLNGIDPNIINFTLRLGNQNFNTHNPTGNFLVLSGVPGYQAVLVNSDDFANASWTRYDGIVRMNLGETDGVYQVWTGLRNFATNSDPPVWIGTKVTLTRTPPELFITNPATNVVAQPYLQLQGYSAKPVASLCCDISNEVAVITNLPGSVIHHTLDTNTLEYTSDYFQCYDILLINGPNLITLRVTDPAGNTTTTNINVTLDYSTATNPMIDITWPQNGDKITGNSFIVRGWTEDAVATVAATIVDANGITNTINGTVERNGKLWVESLPLATGSNWVTLAVTNTAGLSSVTNFAVLKSDLVLTMNPVGESLWHGYVTVTGYVSDDTRAVWVNGVKAVVTPRGDGTANWTATRVPVTEGGVASFDVTAYEPDEEQPDGSYGNGGGN